MRLCQTPNAIQIPNSARHKKNIKLYKAMPILELFYDSEFCVPKNRNIKYDKGSRDEIPEMSNRLCQNIKWSNIGNIISGSHRRQKTAFFATNGMCIWIGWLMQDKLN